MEGLNECFIAKKYLKTLIISILLLAGVKIHF
jgi:hypothetical protein